MIVKLLMLGMGVAIVVLTLVIFFWWRSKWAYIYFGKNARLQSWYATLFGSFLISSCIVGVLGIPITWLNENCPYLLDVVAVAIIAYLYFNGDKSEGEQSREKDTINGDESSWVEKYKKPLIITGVVVLAGAAGMAMTDKGEKKIASVNTQVTQNTVKSNNTNQGTAPVVPSRVNDNTQIKTNDTSTEKKEIAKVFFGFHKNITKKNYRKAYDCLSNDFKSEVSYEGWAPGFKTTVSSTPKEVKIVSQSSNRVELSYTLEAVDNPGGTKYFKGTAILINTPNGWKIDDIINKAL